MSDESARNKQKNKYKATVVKHNPFSKKWTADKFEARSKLKMADGLMPWTEFAKPQCNILMRSERCVEVANVAWFKLRRQYKAIKQMQLRQNAWCDISQNVTRTPCSWGVLPVYTTSSLIYSYERDLVLSGSAHLMSMGWPSESHPMGDFSDCACRSLSGDSCSVPCTALVMCSCILNPWAPWWTVW